jgi:hypothetical protein
MIDNVVLIVTGTLHERDVQVRRSCTCVLPAVLFGESRLHWLGLTKQTNTLPRTKSARG